MNSKGDHQKNDEQGRQHPPNDWADVIPPSSQQHQRGNQRRQNQIWCPAFSLLQLIADVWIEVRQRRAAGTALAPQVPFVMNAVTIYFEMIPALTFFLFQFQFQFHSLAYLSPALEIV